jgi:rhodanese-related sulfurtransferase
MQTLFLRTFILLFIALAVGAAHSWNTGLTLHLQDQDEFDWASLDASGEPEPSPGGLGEDAAAPDASPAVPVTESPERPRQTTEAQAEGSRAEASPGDPYVSVERARRLFDLEFLADGSQVIFIDARARSEFEKGHIERAMSLPAGDFGGRIPAKARDWLPGSTIVIYCQGEECTDSHDVARRLQTANIGIVRIFIFKAGYPAWVEAGHPTATGPDLQWDL